ncbi:hypothetical protein NDU88_001652 [Pleurodeles waltl]|uniref:Uncharacterized protein n=1 Tax=Pleurodeles waltl TaxID=8319 RepID=A0AAV7NBE6_PLEWA|nr:hypothetical protein NDU88_001652 [Pleurodeles waltl]
MRWACCDLSGATSQYSGLLLRLSFLTRSGAGDGGAQRSGAGDGGAQRSGAGDGGAQRSGAGDGGAQRSGS